MQDQTGCPPLLNNKPLNAKTVARLDRIRQLISLALGPNKEAIFQTRKRRSSQSLEGDSIEQILAHLHKGYLMTKHSQSATVQPHTKFVYLSGDNRQLCWKSLQKMDQKKINLCTITRVVKDGAQFLFKGKTLNNLDRCIIIMSQERNLQLEASSELEATYLKYQLERAIRYAQSLYLNYKYTLRQ